MYLKIYELDPARFFQTMWLAWQTALKKIQIKLDLFTDIDMLLVIEKIIREGICHALQYAKANEKYMKDYDDNKEASYLK